MGRKAIDRERKQLSKKAEVWVKELFYKVQYEKLNKLTLDDLATLIQKSKSTIYTYFKTKDEIYQTMVAMVLNDIQEVVFDELPNDSNLVVLYESILLKISDAVEGISIHFLDEIQTNFPQIWTEIKSVTDKVLITFSLIYEEGMKTDVFTNFNITLLLAMDNTFIMSIMTDHERFKNEKLSLKDIVSQYLQLRIKALTK
ncbi:TetR/AcrR family transcriptional regulator [uncultured Tenacibaculum sp.]|uniref:TetR/AcrR family transcriptional regulator n=1 Tax=uncultured Tenacibaculum sp. TaxID=174713 RepID=UPI002621AB62|nr:TetR/AcrR family transcriptional regulator [uncultured Tenacibaculum sp.]